MNILILNWRDIKNPKGGGAEVLTHEIAKGLVKKGNNVTQFSSLFKGGKKKETIDGVEVVRRGRPDVRHIFSSVHFEAYKFYKKNKGKYDLVIDEVHGVPFFTPLYVKEKKVALICEVAGGIWDITFSFPFNHLGKAIEKIYPRFYSGIQVVTISNSSKEALVDLGFVKALVSVIPLGCSVPIIEKKPSKNNNKTLIFVSRLTKSKGIEDALRAVHILKDKYSDIKLLIIGRGDDEYVSTLRDLIEKLGIKNNIEFKGFVSEKNKWKFLEEAHILLAPSSKEGWGLTIHEAGSRGTPAIGYNVEGLRDVIVDNKNGILCRKNNFKELAANVDKLLSDSKLYKRLQDGSIEERRKFSWDRTRREFIDIISR